MVDMRFWNDAPCYFRYHSQVTWFVRELRPFGTRELLLAASTVAYHKASPNKLPIRGTTTI